MGSRSRIWLGALGLLAAAALQAGCGSESTTGTADPAAVTPASAPLYVSFAVKPSGGPRGVAGTDVQRLTHMADPFGKLAESLLRTGGARPRFQGEVEPWVGERAGVFLLAAPTGGIRPLGQASVSGHPPGEEVASTAAESFASGLTRGLSMLGAEGFAAGREQGAIVLDVSDESRAQAFLDRLARRQAARSSVYRGVRFRVSPSGQSMGIVNGFAVIGSESGVRSVIDTAHGAKPLTGVEGYLKPPSNAIAGAYLVPPRLKSTSGAGAATGAAGGLLASVTSASLLVTAGASSLSLEGQFQAAGGAMPLLGQAGAQVVRMLPGGSWLALGLADSGASLPRVLSLLQSASGGVAHTLSALGLGGVQRLVAKLGSSARLRRSFMRWAGTAGLFASGASLFELQAALVIDSKDPSASRAAVGELASVAHGAGAAVQNVPVPGTDAAASLRIPGFPAVLYVADGQGKFIVGLGAASVLGALHPSGTLAGSPAYTAAASALGGGVQPGLIAEFPMLLSMLEAIGATQNPALAEAVPYLKSLGRLTAGSVAGEGRTIHVRASLQVAGANPGG